MPGRRAAAPAATRPRAFRAGLRRLLGTVRREVDRAVRGPHASPATLHDLHRDLRRLAGGLRLWGELLSPRHATDLPPMVRRVRRFARLVGRVRDRDVTLELLEPFAPSAGIGATQETLRRFLTQLREDARTGRELLRAFLTSERRGGLFDQIGAALDRPVRASAHHQLVEIFHEEWRDHRRQVRKAHRRARKRPSAVRLHRLRIRIRRWRHLASLAEIANIPPPERLGPRLRTLQVRLGRLHDLDVALASLPKELARSAIARRLASERSREQATTHAAFLASETAIPRPRPGNGQEQGK